MSVISKLYGHCIFSFIVNLILMTVVLICIPLRSVYIFPFLPVVNTSLLPVYFLFYGN